MAMRSALVVREKAGKARLAAATAACASSASPRRTWPILSSVAGIEQVEQLRSVRGDEAAVDIDCGR